MGSEGQINRVLLVECHHSREIEGMDKQPDPHRRQGHLRQIDGAGYVIQEQYNSINFKGRTNSVGRLAWSIYSDSTVELV